MRLIFRSSPFLTAIVLAGFLSSHIELLLAEEPVNKSKEKWQSLFNGNDLTGWTVKCKPEDREKGFWRVDKGTILANSMGQKGHDYVWLVSNKEYTDFVLRLRFQMFRDSPGNSGVQIRSRYDDEDGWLDGPQVDINPPGPWRTGRTRRQPFLPQSIMGSRSVGYVPVPVRPLCVFHARCARCLLCPAMARRPWGGGSVQDPLAWSTGRASRQWGLSSQVMAPVGHGSTQRPHPGHFSSTM